ncbi:MAG TPA: mycothiol conjugate amidase Mca [Acidimicrobiales bacterium]|nr:mycothiol conjugate amidase Mca [Acidimicrobiales bacterium]
MSQLPSSPRRAVAGSGDPKPHPGDHAAPLCLLCVHAHPDDEASKGAATVARYHAEGVRTILVTCTGGEEGEILNPAMDTPEVRADLAGVRRRELLLAAQLIGYDHVELLGYRDSGMAGTVANDDPRCLARAPIDEATGRLVAVIRRERPQVVVTYPEDQSGYPHPDHLRVHELSLAAFEAAGDPGRYRDAGEPWQPAKLYYCVWSVERMRQRHAKFLELGLESPYAERIDSAAARTAPEPTTSVSIAGFEEARQEGLLAHATQVDPSSPFWFGLPPHVERSIYPFDDYVLARSHVGAAAGEDDLFAGARAAALAPGTAGRG